MRKINICQIGSVEGHDTIEGAITAADNHPRQHQARADEDLLKGEAIVGAWWNDAEFYIFFTNEKQLHVYIDDKARVVWAATERDSHALGKDSDLQDTEPVLINIAKADYQYVMDRSDLIGKRMGAKVPKLWVNELGFYVYTQGCLTLGFSVVRCADTQQLILIVSEDD